MPETYVGVNSCDGVDEGVKLESKVVGLGRVVEVVGAEGDCKRVGGGVREREGDELVVRVVESVGE